MAITKEDWNDAMDAFAAEMCATLGGHPTEEEANAFYAGTMSEPDAERMRARLIFCAKAETFPAEGDPITPEQLAESWHEMQARLRAGK